MGIEPGIAGAQDIMVEDKLAINFLGLPGARVLATPWMIAQMEMVSRDLIKPLLPDGFDSVGTHVDVRHLAATPMGMRVRFTAEVVQVNDRRIRFRVEAHDGTEKVGEGTHERAIIHVEKFAAKVQEKLRGSN